MCTYNNWAPRPHLLWGAEAGPVSPYHSTGGEDAAQVPTECHGGHAAGAGESETK